MAGAFCASLLGAATAHSQELERIRQAGKIVIAHRESAFPFSYLNDSKRPVGYSMDICARLVNAIRAQLKMPDLRVEYLLVTPASRVPDIVAHKASLECGSTTNTAGRQRDVAFAVTTYVEEVRIAVKASSPINSVKDLAGKQVVTTGNTTVVGTLKKYESVGFKTSYSKEHSESFSMLDSGKMDAFVMDASILASNISQSKNPSGFKIVGEVLSVEPIACMLRKDDPMFKAAVDDSIKAQIADGSLAKLYDKWFMQPIPPKNTKIGLPLSTSTKAAWKKPNDNPVEAYAK